MTLSSTTSRSAALAASSRQSWSDPPSKRRTPGRRRARLFAGAALLIVGAWVTAAAFLSVGHRREVLVLARSVPRYSVLTRSDLRTVRVASDDGLALVDASRLASTVGRIAAVDLTAGTNLSNRELLKAGTRPVRSGESVVGTLLAPADAPDPVPQGARVQIIVRPAQGTTGEDQVVDGWILHVEDASGTSGGGHLVSLVVPSGNAHTVSSAAADRRVSVVVRGGS
jgi:hypothetical protein